jgi:hypothetical protein
VTGVCVAVYVAALMMLVMSTSTLWLDTEPRRPFDLAPAWLGPGVRGVRGHRALPEPGRDWVIA